MSEGVLTITERRTSLGPSRGPRAKLFAAGLSLATMFGTAACDPGDGRPPTACEAADPASATAAQNVSEFTTFANRDGDQIVEGTALRVHPGVAVDMRGVAAAIRPILVLEEGSDAGLAAERGKLFSLAGFQNGGVQVVPGGLQLGLAANHDLLTWTPEGKPDPEAMTAFDSRGLRDDPKMRQWLFACAVEVQGSLGVQVPLQGGTTELRHGLRPTRTGLAKRSRLTGQCRLAQ